MNTPLRLAHRGDTRKAPENTLPALLAGARAPGSDGVEFDVRLSRDRVPVVIHDATLARVQGLDLPVRSLSAAELASHGVPALADVLAALPRRAFLDVELKEPVGPETVAILAAGRGPSFARAAVSSFHEVALHAVGDQAATWTRWLNTFWLDDERIGVAMELGCTGISSEWHGITPAGVRAARAAGLDLVAWTVRRRPTVTRLARLGARVICVEGPPLDG